MAERQGQERTDIPLPLENEIIPGKIYLRKRQKESSLLFLVKPDGNVMRLVSFVRKEGAGGFTSILSSSKIGDNACPVDSFIGDNDTISIASYNLLHDLIGKRWGSHDQARLNKLMLSYLSDDEISRVICACPRFISWHTKEVDSSRMRISRLLGPYMTNDGYTKEKLLHDLASISSDGSVLGQCASVLIKLISANGQGKESVVFYDLQDNPKTPSIKIQPFDIYIKQYSKIFKRFIAEYFTNSRTGNIVLINKYKANDALLDFNRDIRCIIARAFYFILYSADTDEAFKKIISCELISYFLEGGSFGNIENFYTELLKEPVAELPTPTPTPTPTLTPTP